jgi:nucleoside-diphosphate-sugar epimerase
MQFAFGGGSSGCCWVGRHCSSLWRFLRPRDRNWRGRLSFEGYSTAPPSPGRQCCRRVVLHHIDDAATATLTAVERGEAGIYNIVDDEPAPVSKWLPALASAIGAKRSLWIPAFLARFLVGDHGVAIMTQVRGASNDKAKRGLGWHPVFATWRDGFRRGLGNAQA